MDHTISGEEIQTLQFILQPGHKLTVDMSSLCWCSTSVVLRPRITSFERLLGTNVMISDAMNETIDVVKEYVAKGTRGIFHCFSGNYENAKTIIDAGFYLGIGGVLTYKNAGLAEVIAKIDLQHIVLETDSPYLTPAPFRGKQNESSYLKYILEKLAAIKNVTVEEVAAITTANAEKIFGL